MPTIRIINIQILVFVPFSSFYNKLDRATLTKQQSFLGDYYGFGFEKTKREAIALQKSGAHVISIGTGRVDLAELRALASYPKLYNSLSPVSIPDALQKSLNSLDSYLGGK